jgi:hypothetical protein
MEIGIKDLPESFFFASPDMLYDVLIHPLKGKSFIGIFMITNQTQKRCDPFWPMAHKPNGIDLNLRVSSTLIIPD